MTMNLLSRLFKPHQEEVTPPIQQEVSQNVEVEAIIEGRRHRIDTAYLLPKDDKETNRLDFQHYALKQVLGANYKAPIDPDFLRSILDVGTGTGRWVIDLAREYPHTRVIGFDIEIPDIAMTCPQNCTFYGGNVLERLPFPSYTFDFTHQRLLVGAIPAAKWPHVISELVRVTRPGGWVELLESGKIYHNLGPAQNYLQEVWDKNGARLGFDLSLIPNLDKMLIHAGLKGVKMEVIQMPLGKWAGRGGELMGIDMYNVIKGFKGFYTSKMGMPSKTFDDILTTLPQEWETNHTTYAFYLVYGQK